MPKKTKKKSVETITMKVLFEELGIDPKKARNKMRKAGYSAEGKRYPDVARNSKEHKELEELLS